VFIAFNMMGYGGRCLNEVHLQRLAEILSTSSPNVWSASLELSDLAMRHLHAWMAPRIVDLLAMAKAQQTPVDSGSPPAPEQLLNLPSFRPEGIPSHKELTDLMPKLLEWLPRWVLHSVEFL
jgi:hypothetical protein